MTVDFSLVLIFVSILNYQGGINELLVLSRLALTSFYRILELIVPVEF